MCRVELDRVSAGARAGEPALNRGWVDTEGRPRQIEPEPRRVARCGGAGPVRPVPARRLAIRTALREAVARRDRDREVAVVATPGQTGPRGERGQIAAR